MALGMGSAKTQGKNTASLEVPGSTSRVEAELHGTLASSIPEPSGGKEDRGTLNLWFISLLLPL